MTSGTSPEAASSWPWTLRLLHAWLAVAVVAALSLRGAPHVWAGLAVIALVVLRLILGFVGPKPARFAAMVPGPIWADLSALMRRVPWGRTGLRPANGALAFLLLLAIAAAGVSGFSALAEIQSTPNGPGKGIIIGAPPSFAADAAPQPPSTTPPVSRRAQTVHTLLSATALAALILHIFGAGLASWAERVNLFARIFAGKKRAS